MFIPMIILWALSDSKYNRSHKEREYDNLYDILNHIY